MRRSVGVVALVVLLVCAGCQTGYGSAVARFDRADPDSVAYRTVDGSPDRFTPLYAAVETGESNLTARWYGDRNDDGELILEHERSFYRVTRTRLDERRVVPVKIETTAVTNGTAETPLDALSPTDRRRLRSAIANRPFAPLERFYSLEVADESRLLALEETSVRVNGTVYRVSVSRESTRVEPVYVYRATVVGENASEYAAWIRDRHAVTPEVPPESRELVDELTAGEPYRGTADEAYRSLYRTLDEYRPYREDEAGATWLVRIDGRHYWAQFQWDGHTD